MSRFKATIRPYRPYGVAVRTTEIADIAARRAYVERMKAYLKAQSTEAA